MVTVAPLGGPGELRYFWYHPDASASYWRNCLHEILDHLPRGARILDLGCREGSFPAGAYDFLTIRVDLTRPRLNTPLFVQADAIHLPFPSRTFDAVILNHSVEHFVHLKPALQEIGRLIKRDGAAFVAVPDARTLTDRIYRKVFRNVGGHVNLFDSATELEKMLSWYFGLPHIATRTLFSSLSFLNQKNTRDPAVQRQMRFPGLWEPILALATATTRILDRWFDTRTGVYGWGFYFGNAGESIDVQPLANVCVRCGQAHPSHTLEQAGCVGKFPMSSYYCPDCAAFNIFFRDPVHTEPRPSGSAPLTSPQKSRK
jgi:ubiquinone/menaquinone biosynthesis C-methylase UbiE